jgi:DNA uptake protein ComE-like DNA-binding protein
MILLEASKLFSLSSREISSIKLLASIPFFIGIYFFILRPPPISLEEYALRAYNTPATSMDIPSGYSEISTFTKRKERPLNCLSLNEATLEDLIKQPEIGIKYASLILDERKKKFFSSWDDFANRLKSIGNDKLDKLKNQGLKVSCD